MGFVFLSKNWFQVLITGPLRTKKLCIPFVRTKSNFRNLKIISFYIKIKFLIQYIEKTEKVNNMQHSSLSPNQDYKVLNTPTSMGHHTSAEVTSTTTLK